MSEVPQFNNRIPYMLVGLKKDLRFSPITIEELKVTGEHPVTPEEVMNRSIPKIFVLMNHLGEESCP